MGAAVPGGAPPSPSADAARGEPQSRCRCGRGRAPPVPVQMWQGASPSPGADVGRVSPSPGADVAGACSNRCAGQCTQLWPNVGAPVQEGQWVFSNEAKVVCGFETLPREQLQTMAAQVLLTRHSPRVQHMCGERCGGAKHVQFCAARTVGCEG